MHRRWAGLVRLVWVVTAMALVAVSGVHVVASGEVAAMAGAGAATAFFGGVAGLGLAQERPDRWTWVRRSTVWSGSGTVVLYCLTSAWAGLGLGLGAVLVLTSPVVLRLAYGQLVSLSARRTSGPPEALRTRDLHRRWEWTTAEVLHPRTSVSRRLVLSEERRQLLDELQRRDPARFDTWIARAAPERGADRPRAPRW